MTVFGFGPGKRRERPFKNYPWMAADIQFCLRASNQYVVKITDIRSEFSLEFDNGRRWTADVSAPEAAETFSAVGRTIAPDECVRAPVVFGVPNDVTVVYVMLVSPLGILRWRAD